MGKNGHGINGSTRSTSRSVRFKRAEIYGQQPPNGRRPSNYFEAAGVALSASLETCWEPPVPRGGRFAPTDAVPGTRAKVQVMAQRLEMGLPLWHDEDPTILPDVATLKGFFKDA